MLTFPESQTHADFQTKHIKSSVGWRSPIHCNALGIPQIVKFSNPTRELTHQEFPDRLLSEVLQTLAEVDQQSVVEPEHFQTVISNITKFCKYVNCSTIFHHPDNKEEYTTAMCHILWEICPKLIYHQFSIISRNRP